MVYYIVGDEVVSEMCDIEAFEENWGGRADEETNAIIVEAMKEMFNI
jgi:hypothetical protein